MKPSLCILALLSAVVFTLPARVLGALKWLPVTAEDRAATESTIDPDAGAEILYRMMMFDDDARGAGQTVEYVRMKVFNDKGVQRVAKQEITCLPYSSIGWLQARVIKPDGTIINVDKKSFYDRKVIQSEDVTVQARSFSFPQLAPGDIAEYQVGMDISGANVTSAKLYFQSDLPTQHVIFQVRPIPVPPGSKFGTVGFWHGSAQQELTHTKDGFNILEMFDMPAFVTEPYMPPKDDVQKWMTFYQSDKKQPAEVFWKKFGKAVAADVDRLIKKSSSLAQEKAASLTAGASTPEEKLARIEDYCRQSIINATEFRPPEGVDRQKVLVEERTPDDVIQSGAGGNRDLSIAFIAMARSLGLDARVVLASSWTQGAFKKDLKDTSYLNEMLVAVKLGDDWKFYDPKECRTSPGTLNWSNEGNAALVATANAAEWVTLPGTPIEKSQLKRTARLRVDEAGTLTGTVSIEYSGQALNDALYSYYKKMPTRIAALVANGEKSRIPSCKASNVKVTGSHNLKLPFKLTYDVTVPGYAERAGSRLFIQPAYFEKGLANKFPAEKRINDIFFSNNIEEVDDVTIAVPPGCQVEEGSAPVSKGKEDWGNWGLYTVSLGYKKNDNTIIYKRDFLFRPKTVAAAKYSLVKTIYDHVFEQDAHMITLNGLGPAASAPQAAEGQNTGGARKHGKGKAKQGQGQ